MPEVHGVDKELDPHMKPEQQYSSKGATPKKTLHASKQGSISKECLKAKLTQ